MRYLVVLLGLQRAATRPASVPIATLALLAIFALIQNAIHPTECITITTVLAGKKKFKSYDLGIPLLPTLVKVKPNRFHLAFRQNNYNRPSKFKIEGSLPLKVPTIIQELPRPSDAYEKVQEININQDIHLGVEPKNPKGKNGRREQYAAGTEEHQQSVQPPIEEPLKQVPPEFPLGEPPAMHEQDIGSQFPPPPPAPFMFNPMMMPFVPPFLPFMESQSMPPEHQQLPNQPELPMQTPEMPMEMFSSRSRGNRNRRSLNLKEPYHHHVNKISNQAPPFPPVNMEQFLSAAPSPYQSVPYGFPLHHHPYVHHHLPPSRAIFTPHHHYPPSQLYPGPYHWGPIAMRKEDQGLPRQQMLGNEPVNPPDQPPVQLSEGAIAVDASQQAALEQQRPPVPMKINIGEHYNPNLVYMDESIVPNFEDPSLLDALNGNMVEEPAEMEAESQYSQQYYKGGNKQRDTGPDDFRINFKITGAHGGRLVPLGTGDRIEQYYRHLKQFDGNTIPFGLPPDQVYKYYNAHTFTDGIKIYRMTPAKVFKSKLLKAIFG